MQKTENLDANSAWKKCLTIIKENVTLMTYNTWFLPIRPVSLDQNTLKVQLPNPFFWEWIDEHFSTIVKKTIYDVLGPNGKLSYIIADEKEIKEEDLFNSANTSNPVIIKTVETKKPSHETNLNPRYKFENFIKGEGNQLARAAAGAISDNPGGTSFNPFFVYGGVGLGKTHLIQSIGNSIVEKFPGKKVIYLSTDSFTVEFVEAIQANRVNEFSGFYRNMDVLIIDDIQFITGKEKTQDLFFHIFNTLHQSRKQIILSSDKPPKELKGLDERLISRFQWGLSADIQPPELEMRIAILKNKAEDYGMMISTEILEYLANNITSNIRELEGSLIKLLASASLNSKEITLDLAKRTVKEIATDRKINITIDDISKIICTQLNIPENKIREKTRKKEIVLARQLAMYFSKELTKNSLKTIGLHFGGRDHSTVIHACNNVEQMHKSDTSMRDLIDSIRNKLELNYS
ncbi:MAG: chromosomal replication initiator protein DnaA [Chlorobi bacterium]|nr:chromosomal replication initiator protein DnaA [Ignavibacteriota bacterium]MBL1161171.1 chromosomal replication initiator protein DnaA [Chlorobiota bacterium]MBW7843604.1 chromosomal replication initiator protein DnaA [Ignavibacterium sp.]MCO6446266.1 chromosomal replication initiator protein DnaA [Ignavibacterium album]NOG67639.1 chromosomal replication initiator protein DnaA [Chlorobiota bacterium]